MGDPLGDVLYHRQILTIGLGLSLLGFRKGFRKMMEARQEKMKVKKKKRIMEKQCSPCPDIVLCWSRSQQQFKG